MELGDFKLTVVSDGEFRLDGGAMFGVVPRALWEKEKPPDERNRIRMGTNCLLVERGNDLLLVDTGIGDKHDPRFLDNYGLAPGATRLPESIRHPRCPDAPPLRPLRLEHATGRRPRGPDLSEGALLAAERRGRAWAASQ
jgi:hypothetical protein